MSQVETGWYSHATPEAQESFRDWLLGKLNNIRVFIKFNKKDGTERKMICTINQKYINEEAQPKGTGRAKSDEALAVFDVELQEWRSFRFDSIKSVGLLV